MLPFGALASATLSANVAGGVADPPVTLHDWEAFYVERGALIVLSYLDPADAAACRSDQRAYNELVARQGIVGDGSAFVGTGFTIPKGGWQKLGRVLVAYVMAARPDTLGALLPRTLNPCKNGHVYSLQMVTLLRREGNAYHKFTAPVQDVLENVGRQPLSQTLDETSKAGGALAADALESLLSVVFNVLLPVAIPLAVLGYAYVKLRK